MTFTRMRIATILLVLAVAAPALAADPPPAAASPAVESGRPKPVKPADKPAEKPVETPGESPAADAAASPASAAAAQDDDPDLDTNLAQPDFMLSALPTTLRVPRNRLTFRLTHRFNQPLEDSGIGDLWGLDSGAMIGFEFRYGLIPGGQVGFYRTSDATIELFSQYDVFKQGVKMPLGLAAYG